MLNYVADLDYKLFKPKIDDRFSSTDVCSRNGMKHNAFVIDENNPEELIKYLEDSTKVVAIDEAQFFSFELVDVVHFLRRKNLNVIVSGLDTDFRGKPFCVMSYLCSVADYVEKLHAICEYKDEHGNKCNNLANRSQRLINGKPAPYDSPIIMLGDEEYYEARCIHHHIVPGKD